jgi:hypothetical protein
MKNRECISIWNEFVCFLNIGMNFVEFVGGGGVLFCVWNEKALSEDSLSYWTVLVDSNFTK